ADQLAGGAGADLFVYKAVTESKTGSIDLITDFAPGQDRIDLSQIDANTKVADNQPFSFIGSNAFHKIAGELRASYAAGTNITSISGDTNGDAKADFEIHLAGAPVITSESFIL